MKQIQPGFYPFWFWNGDQQEDEIERQMRQMAGIGCRGVALHARVGNRTPYLSQRWFDCIRFACEVAQQLGMKIWIYDEEGFPSGNAGKRVQAQRPDLCQKYLAYAYEGAVPDAPAYAAFDPKTFRLVDETKVAPGIRLLRFRSEIFEDHVDTLNRESCDLFLQLTHEEYLKQVGYFFGNVIEAVYTDDESYLTCARFALVFSPVLEKEYAARYGADFKTILPALVENLPDSAELRHRYYSLANELFIRNFITPQVEWCHAHGLPYLGHLCCDEGNLAISIKSYGTPFSFYYEEDIPSIDDFVASEADQRYLSRIQVYGDLRPNLKAGSTPMNPLFLYAAASAVAHQFKKDRLCSEVLTFLDWNISPDFQNTQLLFELGQGVNLLTHHAYYYTLGRGTHNDCPGSYGPQQPYFPLQKERYAGWERIAERLTHGKHHAEVLVLYPEDLWSIADGENICPAFHSETRKNDPLLDREIRLNEAIMHLQNRHIGFDLGDETLLDRFGKAENGKIILGDMSYGAVMICGEGTVLQPKTAALFEQFKQQGGRILSDADADLEKLAPSLQLSGDGVNEIAVNARDCAAFRECYLVNLSGRDLTPDFAPAEGGTFSLYDPFADAVVFTGEKLPADFILRKGCCVMMVAPDDTAKQIPFRDSICFKLVPGRSLEPELIRPLNELITGYRDCKSVLLETDDPLDYKTLYVEDIDTAKVRINRYLATERRTGSHPCDPCYQGIDLTRLLLPGDNRIELEEERDRIYLARKPKDMPGLKHGDLAAQEKDFAAYWGAVLYRYQFDGPCRFIKVEVLGGAADVRINGEFAGTIFGYPHMVKADKLCKEHNVLEILLYNTAQNFVEAGLNPAPFGIESVTLEN